jgi:N utilization substance protein A
MEPTILQIIQQICEEKGISMESVLEGIEAALAVAYRKDFGTKNQNIKVKFDPETGKIEVFDVKTVVPDEMLEKKEEGEKFNPKLHIILSEALKIKPKAKVGEEIRQELKIPTAFGRVAAQTAKQVITQKLREAERKVLYEEFKAKENEIVNGIIQRTEGNVVLVDLGRLTAVMPREEQIEKEKYNPGQRLRVYITSVEMTTKGPSVIVSRVHPGIVKKLFISEIPEIAAGTVEIKSIAREAGSRSKVAVYTTQENIDPIGSCIGQRGTRIQTIIAELGGEKVDVVEWSEDPEKFITNALSPAKILRLELNEKEKSALVYVSPDQLSLAIGKEGQNVRLSAKLTGWKINIQEEKEEEKKEKKSD